MKSIDSLRKLKQGSNRTYLQWIKDPVGCPSPNTLKDLLNRIEHVRNMRLSTKGLEAIHPDMRRRMTVTVQVYSVDNLYADFQAQRRRAFLASYLYERQQALVDMAVETFDGVAQGMYRRSESERDEQVRRHAPALNEKVRMFGAMAGVILDTNILDAAVRSHIFEQIPRDRLSAAHAEAEELVRPEDFNCFDFLERRYNYLRGFFPHFLRVVELDGTATAEPILQAVRALRYWNAEAIRKVPASAPVDFVPAKWQPYVCPSEGCVDRHYYELCVMNQLHQALQSGEIWAVGGRRYGNVEDLLIPQKQWARIREECYQELGLPKDAEVWLDGALGKLTAQIGRTTRNLSSNPQVFVDNGRVHLKSLDPEELPQRVVKLKERIATTWPQIRIQDLLVQVDAWVEFTRFFRTLRGRRPSLPDFGKALFASLIAKGCNIGIVKMTALAPGIRQGTFRRIDEIYLFEDTLRRVIEHLVETTHSLPIADLVGDDSVSMSDGMRLRTRVRSFNAAYMPEHFAPGQRAITYHWHVSHQGPAYGAQVFGNDRDAAYVLDQVLHIRSELPIKEHYTDTHGATENTFALAEAFGIEFCPRIKGIHAQQLYYPPGMKVPRPLKAHFAGPIDVELIKEHWDDYVRILASISRGVTSVVLLSQRLSSYAKHNPLYRVIREAGRIRRTRHILRVYDEPIFRRRINSGLDRVENFNYLGIYSGILLALQYCFLVGIVVMQVKQIWTWNGFLMTLAIPATGLVLVAIPWGGWRVLCVTKRYLESKSGRTLWITFLMFAGPVLALLLGLVPADADGLIFAVFVVPGLAAVVASPVWMVAVFAGLTRRIRRMERRRFQLRLIEQLGVFSWLAAYMAAWRFAIVETLDAYAALPTSPPSGCYVATAAARGHPWFVRSWVMRCSDGEVHRVNMQLAHLKCGELILRTICPQLHRWLRRLYDAIGPLLAAMIAYPLAADFAYTFLKPAEWVTRVAVACAFPGAAAAARTLYSRPSEEGGCQLTPLASFTRGPSCDNSTKVLVTHEP